MVKAPVPKAKLSKKEKRRLNAEKRVTWSFSPATRTVKSKKLYSRKTLPRGTDCEEGFFEPADTAG